MFCNENRKCAKFFINSKRKHKITLLKLIKTFVDSYEIKNIAQWLEEEKKIETVCQQISYR